MYGCPAVGSCFFRIDVTIERLRNQRVDQPVWFIEAAYAKKPRNPGGHLVQSSQMANPVFAVGAFDRAYVIKLV